MIDDGSEAVDEVFIHAPAGAEGLWDLQDRVDLGLIMGMDVFAPFGVVIVDLVAKRGKEIEVEVVVRVDHPREGDGAVERECVGAFGWCDGIADGNYFFSFDQYILLPLDARDAKVSEPHPI